MLHRQSHCNQRPDRTGALVVKRQHKPSKKLNLDKQAVRELKLIEIEWTEDVTGSTYGFLARIPDADC
jgi:hypothetical protein